MDDVRWRALEDMRELLEATQKLRATLASSEATYRDTVGQLAQGTGISATLEATGAGAGRQRLTAVLDEFEQLRHRSRLSLVAAGLDEGMTIGDLARTWNLSRQLAARHAREARTGRRPAQQKSADGSPSATPSRSVRPTL